MRLIGPTDILAPSAITQVMADLLRRLQVNADIA
jgi:peptide/nickel transport system substrate-binding protein